MYRIDTAQSYFVALEGVLRSLPFDIIDLIAQKVIDTREKRKQIFLFGNGGSASLASHMACDLGKGTSSFAGDNRLKVIALTDNIPTLTAWANDKSYEDIFAEQLRNLMQEGDLAIAISGSGQSPNVLKALEYCRGRGEFAIGLTGFGGGKMTSLCDLVLVVPSDNMQFVEDVHLAVAHCLYSLVSTRLYYSSRPALAATASR